MASRQRLDLLARHHRDVVAEHVRAARAPPGLSDETTGVPHASASTATVGSASSSDGRTKRSAARAVARDRALSTQAGEGHVPFDAADRAAACSSGKQRARAADDELRVGELAHDLAHRLDQEPLARERVQPLDVDEQVGGRQAERPPHRRVARPRRDSVNAAATGG